MSNDANEKLVQLQDAVVRRGGKTLLEVRDFSLAYGECVAVLGPNGAGKSTFIQLITRETFPLHRDVPPVLFCGEARTTLDEMRRRIGIVSATMQDQITKHITALEVVMGGLHGTLGIPPHISASADDRARALKAMAEVGIEHLADRDVMTMSSGQARRVLIARALINDPILLICDEPCNGLDPEGQFYVRASMRKVAQSGTALMLVTHYPEDIIPEIDRVLLIKNGQLEADAPKAQALTDEAISSLFNVPIHIECHEGRYGFWSAY